MNALAALEKYIPCERSGSVERVDAPAQSLDRAVDAAVDNDRLAREVAGLRRTEIGAEIADFVRLSHSAHRNGIGEALELFVGRDPQTLRPSGKYLSESVGHDGTGRDIIDGDAVRREIRGNGFGQHRDARANRIRHDKIGHRLFHAVAGQVDDTAASRSLQSRQCLAYEANRAHQIELVGDIPVAVASLFEGGGRRTARIGDKAIQATQYGNGLGYNALHLRRPR